MLCLNRNSALLSLYSAPREELHSIYNLPTEEYSQLTLLTVAFKNTFSMVRIFRNFDGLIFFTIFSGLDVNAQPCTDLLLIYLKIDLVNGYNLPVLLHGSIYS